jgi:glucosamine--fructose-6-phosphate aminotransferase (isomerizing)
VLTSRRLLDDTLAIPGRVRALHTALVATVEEAITDREVRDIDAIYLGGSGDLHHSALATALAFERLTGLPALARSSMPMGLYSAPAMTARSLLIQMTFSGKTARAVESATLAKAAGARVWGVTNDPSSELARLAHLHLTKPDTGGNEAAGYSVTMLLLYLVAVRIGELRGTLGRDDAGAVRRMLADAPDAMARTIDACAAPAHALALRHQDARHVLFLATGPAWASAVNGSARIHEAVGIHASAQDIEEWAHLDRWVDDRASLDVVLAPRGPCRERAHEIVLAMRALAQPAIVVADARDADLGGEAPRLPVHCPLPEELCPLVYGLPGELFAHALGLVRGAAPYRAGDAAYAALGEIRWGGFVRRELPVTSLPGAKGGLPPHNQPPPQAP